MSNDNKNSLSSENKSSKSYEVGYGKPPKAGQFKLGQSGNPKGKRKKPQSVAEQINGALSKKIEVREGGKTRRLTLQEIMFKTIANNAVKGDLKSAEFLLKHKNSIQAETVEFIDQIDVDAEDQAIIDTFMSQMEFGEEIPETEPSDEVLEAKSSDANAELADLKTDNQVEPIHEKSEITSEETISEIIDKVSEDIDAEPKAEGASVLSPASIDRAETHPTTAISNTQSLGAAAAPKPFVPSRTPSRDNPIGQLGPSIQLVNPAKRKTIIIRSQGLPRRKW